MAKKSKIVKPVRKTRTPKVTQPQEPKFLPEDFDFSTAREMKKNDIRNIEPGPVVAFLVDTNEGEEVVYHCMKGHIPTEAKKALGW